MALFEFLLTRGTALCREVDGQSGKTDRLTTIHTHAEVEACHALRCQFHLVQFRGIASKLGSIERCAEIRHRQVSLIRHAGVGRRRRLVPKTLYSGAKFVQKNGLALPQEAL